MIVRQALKLPRADRNISFLYLGPLGAHFTLILGASLSKAWGAILKQKVRARVHPALNGQPSHTVGRRHSGKAV